MTRLPAKFGIPSWLVLLLTARAFSLVAAEQTWTGTGPNGNWQTPANWQAGAAPSAGDSLIFTQTRRLNNTNNFSAGTVFGGLSFQTPAGPFALNGNAVTLDGNITNDQPVTEESVELPLTLGATTFVDVAQSGILSLDGVVSGSGGLTLTGPGTVNLGAANTFTGALTVDAGTATIASDANLGASPASATPGAIVLNGGTLEAAAGLSLDPNRGIAVGSASGGLGTIKVDVGYTLSYGGVIAGNGGTGGLAKSAFGGLTLFGQNTYTGPTLIKNGTLTLDFTQPGSPASDIINSASALTLGGETAGVGNVNNSSLVANGNAGTVNSQTFNGTLIDLGGQVIRANSGTGGSVNLSLGALAHNAGGTVVIIPPASGSITTSSGNNNGILGGWATIGNGSAQNGVLMGTNYAAVDQNGNIVNFSDYLDYTGGNLAAQVTVETNVLFAPASASVMTVDSDNAGTTTDVNSLKILEPATGSGVYIGPGNTLRLGQFGGILAQETGAHPNLYFGGTSSSTQSGNGTSGAGDVGTLTAGGAPDTPGEIDLTINNNNETSGTFIFECAITDNGSGPVKFVKAGPGPMKLDGHNTYSGGLYILQGRLQFAGSEIGNSNPDGGGTGPIYVYPGAELFPSGAGSTPITNNIYISGNGVSDNVGAIRLSGVFSNGIITLIGDSRLGGGGSATGTPIHDKITGDFNLDFGATGNSGSGGNGAILYNHDNDWSGNTTIVARQGSSSNTRLILGASDVIPDGFGKGNVIIGISGMGSSSTCTLDLNGFDETINGLSSAGIVANDFIQNSAASTVSTLSVGNNDQSGTFDGLVRDNSGTGGTLALTKIGAGVETLTAANTYSGPTVVNGGTLALSGSGSISSSSGIQVNSGATLDVSGLSTAFATASPVGLNGGTIAGNASVGALGMTNGALTLDLDPSAPNITAGSLATGGATNLINIGSIFGITGYPAKFTIVQYSGTLGGAGNNFGIGSVPNSETGGYVSNDVADARILLVLTNGPRLLTWTGSDPVHPTYWDVDTTTNWLAFKGTANQFASAFSSADAVTFDDTASSGTVEVVQQVSPGSVEVNNNSLNYTFTGSGSISGKFNVTKDGTGSLLLDNGGLAIAGTFAINGGAVQVGNNDASGSVSASGGVIDNAALVFDRSDNIVNSSAISGTGTVTQNGPGVLTLSGNNSFSGGLAIAQGTLKAGSGSALGGAAGATTISAGATLDVGGQTLNSQSVIVSGAGIGGLGAIINSGAASQNAMGNVTLAGDTTFGGTGRWDVRGGGATLSTSGNAYSLTKVGTNQISLVGVAVDSALGDINVQAGTLSIETSTSGLGDSSRALTLAAGATLQFYGTSAGFNKQFALSGDGLTTTINCANGVANVISGPVTLTGNCLFNAAAGTALTFSGTLAGAGGMLQTGTGTNIIAGSATYSGGTTLQGGTLMLDGSLSGSVSVQNGATLAGTGSAGGNVTVQGGVLSPGDPATVAQSGFGLGSLTLSNGTVALELSSISTSGNDQLNVAGALTVEGTNHVQITPLSYMNIGDTYTLIQYAGTLPGSATNSLVVSSTRTGFSFSVVDPSTTPGAIEIRVDSALGNDFWSGAASAAWDTTTTNWLRNNNPVNFNNGDYVNFDSSSTVTNVSLSGALTVSGITVSGGSEVYRFGGSGLLNGPGGLHVIGTGLVLANSGTNTFSGVIVNDSMLQVGEGGTAGTLGTGVVTNNGTLFFDRSDSLTVSNVITANGSLANVGSGVLVLAGANTFDGEVDVRQGTVRVLNNSALGDTFGTTVVSPGATLDITNTVHLVGPTTGQPGEPIYVSGAGVGGQGAIVNSSGSAYYSGAANLNNLFLQGDTTFGGSGRIDMRSSSATASDATLNANGQPYTLTKVGTNLFQLAGVQIDGALGNIIVQNGTLGFQWGMTLGNTSSNLIVFGGATVAFYDLSNALDKVLTLQDGATVAGQHGSNEFDGPVTLQGAGLFDVSGGTLTFTNTIGGPGSLVKSGGATLILSGSAETYAGDTRVNGGMLSLTDPVDLGNSPAIVLSNATLDVSGRSDGTLTLGGTISQTLSGSGAIDGSLAENPGSTVNPGGGVAPAVLVVTNGATLNGTVILDLNTSAGAVTNDEMIAPNLSAGGMIIVTNLGPDLLSGQKFQLFSTVVSGAPTVLLPAHNAAGTVIYTWQTNITVDGSITLLSGAGTVNTNPAPISAEVGGGQLTLSWPADHTGWILQTQTNSLNVGLSTNWYDMPGSAVTNQVIEPLVTTNGAVFYRLIYRP